MEAGTHSIWISEQLQELGHEVIVANVRELRAISHSDRKSDQVDAEKLARYARLDPKILRPIAHRSSADSGSERGARIGQVLRLPTSGLVHLFAQDNPTRLFHDEPFLLRRPELADPPSSNNRLSRFHPVPRTHGIKPCLQRACPMENALSRRPTVDAYFKNSGRKALTVPMSQTPSSRSSFTRRSCRVRMVGPRRDRLTTARLLCIRSVRLVTPQRKSTGLMEISFRHEGGQWVRNDVPDYARPEDPDGLYPEVCKLKADDASVADPWVAEGGPTQPSSTHVIHPHEYEQPPHPPPLEEPDISEKDFVDAYVIVSRHDRDYEDYTIEQLRSARS